MQNTLFTEYENFRSSVYIFKVVLLVRINRCNKNIFNLFVKFICLDLYRDLDYNILFANYLKKCNLFHFTLTKQFQSQKTVCLTPLYLTV